MRSTLPGLERASRQFTGSQTASSVGSMRSSLSSLDQASRQVPGSSPRSQSVSSAGSSRPSLPALEPASRRVPSASPRSQSVSTVGSLRSSLPSLERDLPPIPGSSPRSQSVSSVGSMRSTLPPPWSNPSLRFRVARVVVVASLPWIRWVQLRRRCSKNLWEFQVPRIAVKLFLLWTRFRYLLPPRFPHLLAGRPSSLLGPLLYPLSLSPVSFTTMTTIIAPPAAPPTPSPVESRSTTVI
jgi:hypothetical protein